MSDFTLVASVGTYHHPFDRFVDWLEPWTREHDAAVVFQHGTTRPLPGAQNHEMLSPTLLLEQYRQADAVVLQGGAGGVMDARKAGRIPIVVPRVPAGHEVVDDHQVVLARRLAELGLVHVAETPEELRRLLDGVRNGSTPTRTTSSAPSPGVAEAVRVLSLPHPARGSSRRPLLLDAGRGDEESRTPPGRSPAGEQFLAVHAQRPRRTVLNVLGDLLDQGVHGYLLTAAISVGLLQVLAIGSVATTAVLAVVLVWLGFSFAAQTARDRSRSLKPVVRLASVVGAALVTCLFLGVQNTPDLRGAVLTCAAAGGSFAAITLLNRRVLRRTRTVLVGEEHAVRGLSLQWDERPDVDVVASCVWRSGAEQVPLSSPSSLSGIVPDVLAAVARNRARRVVISSDRALTTPALRHLAWALQRADVECVVLADMRDHVEYLQPRRVAGQVALAMRPPNHHLVSLAAKSVMDRALSLAALVALAPIMLVVAVLVRSTSRGPVIFRQVRTGLDGEPFTMLKFRTMVADAEERLADLAVYNEGAGPLFKLGNDPRITPVGRVLRRTSLDELPQLFNVLRGQMSLVGPRPALPSETTQYSQWVWRRLHVRPGLTGLWQVSGRSALTWEESIRIDLQYVNNWNLWLDVRILFRTVRAVLARDGAL